MELIEAVQENRSHPLQLPQPFCIEFLALEWSDRHEREDYPIDAWVGFNPHVLTHAKPGMDLAALDDALTKLCQTHELLREFEYDMSHYETGMLHGRFVAGARTYPLDENGVDEIVEEDA